MRDSVASALFQSKRVEDILADALQTFAKLHERSTRQRRGICISSTNTLFKTLESPLKISSFRAMNDETDYSETEEKNDDTKQRALWKRPRGFDGTSRSVGLILVCTLRTM